ncbi:histidine triad nucleotide-binding protein [Silvibacterium sp.]|uniref:histidine triad nucleotide-binding protein n=1 Tax=Silvibacterium sp. TaxID=1964179 RepID=UPI0039E45AFC
MLVSMDCIFCKIAAGEIPSKQLYSDEAVYAFADIDPKAPFHALIIPREHLTSLADAAEHHKAVLGHMHYTAAELARKHGLDNGYRVVINTGADGGQTVSHLHLHLLGGRLMAWPPG